MRTVPFVLVLASTVSSFPFLAPDFVERAEANTRRQLGDAVNGLLTPVLSNVQELLAEFGGGLNDDGTLLPLKGALSGILLPTPQDISVKLIPGNDPDHQYVRPTKDDVRGLCPTMNTMANHGYLNRSGITTFAESANGCQIAFGFGYDLCTFLAALALLAGGDLVTGYYSIGGADPRVPNTLGPAGGLDKHGVFEIDASPSRVDTYFGNQANFNATRWQRMVDYANRYGGGLFNHDAFAQEAGAAYDESRATNPYFYAGLKWFFVSKAERAFVYRGMANGTAPDTPDYANIAPFYLNETFPEEWYRSATPGYTLPGAIADILDLNLANPRAIGANMGSTDNFFPFDIPENLSIDTVADASCFLFETLLDAAIPNQLQPATVETVKLFSGFLAVVVRPFFAQIKDDCPLGNFTAPGPNAGNDTDGSPSADGPAIVNGVYQPN